MLPETVEKYLNDYLYAKGRAEHITAEICANDHEIMLCMQHLDADESAISAQVITDMPHGTTVGNPTEKTAIKLVDGWKPQWARDLEAENAELVKQRAPLLIIVQFVDAWMQGLTERDAWIIKAFYIDRECLEHIQTDYERAFGIMPSTRTLSRYKQKSFAKVCKMAE